MPDPRLPRVLLLIPHLGGGGAERVTALLAQGLSKEKYELHLGLVTQSEVSQFGAERVQIHALGARRVRGGALRLLRLVRSLNPELVLSGMVHLNFLVLLLRPLFPRGTRVIVRQNSTASAALEFGGLPGSTRVLYRLLYRRADRVICQTAAMASDLVERLGVLVSRLAVLPNPIDVDAIRLRVKTGSGPARAVWKGSGPHLLAVGRLSREKGFDLLLQALVQVRGRFPGADLVIAGSGPEEAALKSECLALGLEVAVRFDGYVEDLTALFAGATAFVLSSRHEGMPNALLEAAAAGLPIVALPSSQGVADLLRSRPGVWLANEISLSALATSLLEALDALRPGERFAHDFVEQFRRERAIAAYESLIDSLLHEARP
jgi:glycosyltransferase involved in cell wall biosynthesis